MLQPSIWIDNIQLDEPHPIDIVQLIESLSTPGWFDIFTCGCGIAGCAAIPEGIEVTHAGGMVHWEFRRPISAGALVDPELAHWEKTSRPVSYLFGRAQMVEATRNLLATIREVVHSDPGQYKWPVYGLEITDILALNF